MKTKFILISAILLCIVAGTQAQSKVTKTTIKVYGNCGMCKKRIEAALDHSGIKFAEWDTRTKNLEVVYNNRRISREEVLKLIADSGHDTDSLKARDEVYATLPFCCLYRDHDHSNIVDEPAETH